VIVTFEFELMESEESQLAEILHCPLADLEQTIQPYALAAIREYVGMMLGQRVFTRGSDILEYRLVLMIKHAFGGTLPDEQHVSALFQLSPGGSRSLIRAVSAKYQYELSDEIAQTMRVTIGSVEDDDDGWSFTVNSDHVVEAMNRFLAVIDGALQPVSKKSKTVSTYVLQPTSYETLCAKFGVTPRVKA
jgi:hypothetical protein